MILAAGEGTRLRPLTHDTPKVMLPIAGRPLLEHTVRWLESHGVTEIAMNLHYRPETIQTHFGNGSEFGVSIQYSLEREILGTAGGAKKIEAFLDQPFALVYGDVLTDLDLGALWKFHRERTPSAHLTMSLYRVPNPSECGIVAMDADGLIDRFVEKPAPEDVFSDLASAGVLIVDPAALQHIPEATQSDFGRDVFPHLLRLGFPMFGWPLPASAQLIDIGSPEKYALVKDTWPTVSVKAGGQA
jgi:NDP-sugar pyrophosphorylase family protein